MATKNFDGGISVRSSRAETLDRLRSDGGWRPLEDGPYGASLRELEAAGWVDLQLVHLPSGNRYRPKLTALGAFQIASISL